MVKRGLNCEYLIFEKEKSNSIQVNLNYLSYNVVSYIEVLKNEIMLSNLLA